MLTRWRIYRYLRDFGHPRGRAWRLAGRHARRRKAVGSSMPIGPLVLGVVSLALSIAALVLAVGVR